MGNIKLWASRQSSHRRCYRRRHRRSRSNVENKKTSHGKLKRWANAEKEEFSSVRSFVRSYVRSFVRAFIHSFVVIVVVD
ncbi:hypothetical protein [Absidia glauca]|uniref:Uncharacterized protein n=1 Tax=Absidia glauca TaxID=4829 RepID=A0A163JCD4_ABSGL|nr:hypothetical protein [Absidia glauca]